MTNAKIPGNLRQKYIQAWRKLRDGGEAVGAGESRALLCCPCQPRLRFLTGCHALPLAQPAAPAAGGGSAVSIKRTIQDRTGMDLSKRSRLLLSNVGLANESGENVTTAAIVLEL